MIVRGSLALLGVATISGLLVIVTGCSGDPSAEFQRRCDLVAKAMEPESGRRWMEIVDPHSVDPIDVPEKIDNTLDAWSAEVQQRTSARPGVLLTSEQYDEILDMASAKIGIKSPDCKAWTSFVARAEKWEHLAKPVRPLCENYNTRRKADPSSAVTREGHESLFQEAAKAWRSAGGATADAVDLIDRLVAMGTVERGRVMGAELMRYLQTPEVLPPCDKMVGDAEFVARDN